MQSDTNQLTDKQAAFHWAFIAAIAVLAVALRFAYFVPNLSCIGAVGILAAIYLRHPIAFVLPAILMIASDAIGIMIGHKSISFSGVQMSLVVYGCFMAFGLIGFAISKRANVVTVGAAGLVGAIIFYLVTNFQCWISFEMYSKDLNGLIICYGSAIPFAQNLFIGEVASVIGFYLVHGFLFKELFGKQPAAKTVTAQ